MEEPLHRTLARNVTIAASVAAVFTLVRHDFKSFLPVAALALWPSLGGHFVELLFVNGIRDRIPQGHLVQAVVRLLVWYVGGILLYVCMAATSRALPIRPLPTGLWYYGGLLFVGLQLIVHVILAIRGLRSSHNGRG